MSTTDHTRKSPGMSPISATIVVALALAALVLSACGGSSNPSNAAVHSATTSSSASGSVARSGSGSTPSPRPGIAIRECLKKNGITLPSRPEGPGVPSPGGPASPGGPPVGGVFLNGSLPKGITRTQLQTTLQKCGRGHFFRDARPFSGPGSAGPRNPMFRQALSKFAQCLRQNGINVPDPNTSGHGPIFSTKGLQPNSPKFREAAKKCRSVLFGAFAAGAHPPAGANR